MTSPSAVDQRLICSFCGKDQAEVRKVIAGPGVFICDECVALCHTILEADDGSSRSSIDTLRSLTDDELLAHLPRAAAAGAQVEASLRQRIDLLRERKVSWARIGAALGMARQSAWERFSGEE
jgi:hypothetical protein